MSKSPVYGLRNTLASHQTPKCADGPPQAGLAVHNDKTQPSRWESSKYRYTPGAWSWVSTKIGDSGEPDNRVAWRCPDCGRESDDVTADCCPRCGSCEPLELR